jgi:hypothetical protein
MSKLIAVVIAGALGACAGEARVSPHHVSVNVAAPDLVSIGTGTDVQVIADADQPVFFQGNAYWLFQDGNWYRSNDYRGGWIRVETPPTEIRRIESPYAYVHYRQHERAARLNDERQLEPREEHRDVDRDRDRDRDHDMNKDRDENHSGDTDRNKGTDEDERTKEPIPDKMP